MEKRKKNLAVFSVYCIHSKCSFAWTPATVICILCPDILSRVKFKSYGLINLRRTFQDSTRLRLSHSYCYLFLDLRWQGVERSKTLKSGEERCLSSRLVRTGWQQLLKGFKPLRANFKSCKSDRRKVAFRERSSPYPQTWLENFPLKQSTWTMTASREQCSCRAR